MDELCSIHTSWEAADPSVIAQMPNVSCLLCDVGVTDINRNDDDEKKLLI